MGRLAARIEAFWAALSGRGIAVLLVLLVLAAVLPGFTTLAPVDRDEARFAQASRQMLASGDFIDIRFQDGPRYKKPVGIYWLQSAAVALSGKTEGAAIWRYRLPSLLAALIAVLATARAAAVFGGVRAGLAAGTILAGALIFGFEARLATTDAALLASIALAQAVLARLYRDAIAVEFDPGRLAPRGAGEVALFWGALAASVLIKGPIGLLVCGGTLGVLALWHRGGAWISALRPLWGGALLLALVVPWYLAISLKAGTEFWAEALGRDLLGKVAAAQESHGAPPGTYLTAMWLTFFPGSILLALSLPALWRARRAAWLAFALAWLLPFWLVLELSPTKLPHYVLPLYPALALALAQVWPAVVGAGLRWWQWVLAAVIGAIGPGLLLALGGVAQAQYGALPLAPLVLGLLAVALGGWLAVTALRQRLAGAALAGFWLMGAALGSGSVGLLAQVGALWPAPAIVALAVGADCPAPTLYVAGFGEPSLVFLSPGAVRHTDGASAVAAIADDPCARAVLPVAEAEAALARAGISARLLGGVQGVNLGDGEPVDLAVYGR